MVQKYMYLSLVLPGSSANQRFVRECETSTLSHFLVIEIFICIFLPNGGGLYTWRTGKSQGFMLSIQNNDLKGILSISLYKPWKSAGEGANASNKVACSQALQCEHALRTGEPASRLQIR